MSACAYIDIFSLEISGVRPREGDWLGYSGRFFDCFFTRIFVTEELTIDMLLCKRICECSKCILYCSGGGRRIESKYPASIFIVLSLVYLEISRISLKGGSMGFESDAVFF